MNLKTALPFLILLSACGRKTETAAETPVKATPVAGLEFIDYVPPAGTYTCRAPAHWKGEETTDYGPDEVSFIGEVTKGLAMESKLVSISISKYPNKSDKYVDAEAYAKSESVVSGKPVVYEKKIIEGKTVIRFSHERTARAMHSKKAPRHVREDVALIVVPGGFFEITHTGPVETYGNTLPVFEEVVRSFKPKG
jgi:hypothetical protein